MSASDTMTTRLTDEVKAWIGREITYQMPEELGRASIRLFAIATDDDNPLYLDEKAAVASKHGGVIAPPTLVCETNQVHTTPPRADGYFGHRWELPIESKRTIRGGNEYEFFQPVRPTDRISVTWRILDIYERDSRQAGQLLFIISEARYTNQHGELLAVNRDTTIR